MFYERGVEVSNWNLWRRMAALSVVGAVAAGGIAAGAGSTALAASHHAKKKAKNQIQTQADGRTASLLWTLLSLNGCILKLRLFLRFGPFC